MRTAIGLALIAAACAVVALVAFIAVGWPDQPDHVYDADGSEIDCQGAKWDRCIAAHCLNGYETIMWRDLGQSCTYRCKR